MYDVWCMKTPSRCKDTMYDVWCMIEGSGKSHSDFNFDFWLIVVSGRVALFRQSTSFFVEIEIRNASVSSDIDFLAVIAQKSRRRGRRFWYRLKFSSLNDQSSPYSRLWLFRDVSSFFSWHVTISKSNQILIFPDPSNNVTPKKTCTRGASNLRKKWSTKKITDINISAEYFGRFSPHFFTHFLSRHLIE